MQPELPYHTVVNDCHQVVCVVAGLRKPLPPMLEGRIWQLECPGERLRATIDFMDSPIVIRLSATNL